MDTIQGTWSRRNTEEYAQGIEAANDPELAAYGPDHLRATAQRLDDLGYTMYLHGYAAGLRIRAAELEDAEWDAMGPPHTHGLASWDHAHEDGEHYHHHVDAFSDAEYERALNDKEIREREES